MKIEQVADAILQQGPQVESRKINAVPRSALLRPADAENRLGNQRFVLGDRVVYAQDSGRVPIASRGTVVGLTQTPRTILLDILFDVTFMSGTTLSDRCSPFRGSTVPVSAVLNISNPQLHTLSRASETRRHQPSATPLTVNGYGAPTGPNGRGQFMPAATPPPLRGSYRGAIGGHGNHNGANSNGLHAGRGNSQVNNGPTWQQTTAIRGGPPVRSGRGTRGWNASPGRGMEGNNARGGQIQSNTLNGNGPSQNYQAVPPPANLNATRGGRGRTRGRGGDDRAERGRGRGRVTVAEK